MRREVGIDQYASLNASISDSGIANARILTPFDIELSSLFNPRFFYAFKRDARRQNGPAKAICALKISEPYHPPELNLEEYHLQSMLFLAGVTLSAAIIQNRWSSGTVSSKMTKLWQAGTYKCSPAFVQLSLQNEVSRIHQMKLSPVVTFISLKALYSQARKFGVDLKICLRSRFR